jgi:hypothetical protein
MPSSDLERLREWINAGKGCPMEPAHVLAMLDVIAAADAICEDDEGLHCCGEGGPDGNPTPELYRQARARLAALLEGED